MRMGIDEINEASVERRMEQLLYLVYGPRGSPGATDVWGQLIAFQVPSMTSVCGTAGGTST
jgi:hypothetical protein